MAKEKEKDKTIGKTDQEVFIQQRKQQYIAASTIVRAAVLKAYEDHELLPAEVFSILSDIMSDFMELEVERQREEAYRAK